MFGQFFQPQMEISPRITLTDEMKEIARKFVKVKWRRKIAEYPHDAEQIIERNISGAYGEIVLYYVYGKPEYFDNSIGESLDYNTPDMWESPKNKKHLPNLRIPADIKTTQYGNVPLISRNIPNKLDGISYYCPNIICVTNFESVWILGIASPSVLREYSDTNLIINADNPKKTGFFGGDHLIRVPSTIQELKEICDNLKERV